LKRHYIVNAMNVMFFSFNKSYTVLLNVMKQ